MERGSKKYLQKQWLKSYSNLVKTINTHSQKVQQALSKMKTKKSIPRPIIIKMLPTSDRKILKGAISENDTLYSKKQR